ncbi:inositol monophosphatase [Lentzea sp. NBRC 105346]|nr:inositol monophosphatase [Lentzea sp. NBRC 105346]
MSLDEDAERLLRDQVARHRPHDHVVGKEEGGHLRTAGAEVIWIVDALDGGPNCAAGMPAYCSSIAALVDRVVVASAVSEPRSGRVWSAALGEGARLFDPAVSTDWHLLRVRETRDLERCVLATGYSAHDPNERADQAAVIACLLPHILDIRHSGSPALDLCHVAAGWVDASVHHGLNIWTWAAGLLIAEEAGAITHWPGTAGPGERVGNPALAATPGITADLLDALHDAGAHTLHTGNPRVLGSLP